MANFWHKTQYSGVRFRTHTSRRYKGEPDKYFTMRFRVDGKLREESLGWASEGWTEERASRLLADRKKSKGGSRRMVRNLMGGRELEVLRGRTETTFAELARCYVEWAKRSKRSWYDDVTRLNAHVLPLLGPVILGDIGGMEIEKLEGRCREKGLAPATVMQCLALVRTCFNYAIRGGIFAGPNPAARIGVSKVDNMRVRFLSKHEAELLLNAAAVCDRDVHDMSLLSLYTGMRAGEILSLRWADIDFASNSISVVGAGDRVVRRIPLSGKVKNMLLKRFLSASCAIVFPGRDGHYRKKVSRSFEKMVKQLGFNDNIDDPREKVCFHTLRHTFASWLALQGESISTIRELMGHRSVSATMRYACLIPDRKRKALDLLCK